MRYHPGDSNLLSNSARIKEAAMTVFARNGGVQQCSTAILRCATIHFLLLRQHFFECRRRIAAEVSLAETGTDEIHDNSRLGYGDLTCQMTDCHRLHELGQWVSERRVASAEVFIKASKIYSRFEHSHTIVIQFCQGIILDLTPLLLRVEASSGRYENDVSIASSFVRTLTHLGQK